MRGQAETYLDFSGGLNLAGAPYVLEPSQVRDSLNVHTDPQGAIQKRRGFQTFSSPTTLCHSLAPANTSTKSLLGARTVGGGGSDRVVKIDTGGTATDFATSFTAAKRWEWVQAQTGTGPVGPMYGVNGADTPQVWDGSSGSLSNWVASTGTVPVAKYLKFFGSRIWAAGTASNPNRLYYSGITGTAPDPLNWDANNYTDLEPNDGEQITGLGSIGPYLLVFKPRKTFVITDIVTGANRKVSDEFGCIAHRSIQETPLGTFFLSEGEGVCVTDGTRIRRVSDNVKPTLDTAATSALTLPYAAACFDGSRYFLSYSREGSVNDHTLEYDTITESWWIHTCASNQFALQDPVGTPILYSASPGGTTVDKAFVPSVFQDHGSNYTGNSYFTTAYFIWGNPALMKRVEDVRVDGVGVWSADYATDFSDTFGTMEGELWQSTPDTSGTFGGAGTFGGSGTFGATFTATASYRYYTLGRARAFSFRFTNTDSSDFQMFSITAGITGGTD